MPINEINNKSFLLTLSIEFGLLQKMGLEKANTKSTVPERVMHTIKIINRECIPHLHNIITSIQIPAHLNQDQYLKNELGDLQHFVKRLITILQTREVVEDDSLNYMMEEVSQSFVNIREHIRDSEKPPVRFNGVKGVLGPYFSKTEEPGY
jgi:hypothetical protein